MKIVISGGTEIGLLFAKILADKNDLHVIESDPEAIKKLEQLDLQVINGNPTALSILQEARVKEAGAFIACAHSDEVNVISCLAVKQLSKARTFCFVNRAHYFETFAGELGEELLIDRIIWPEMLLGEYIAQIITVPGAIDVKVFESEDLKLLEFSGNVKVRLIEASLKQCESLAERLSDKVLILNANGTDASFLRAQQVANCDCLIALTGNDERNLFVSMHAKQLNAKKVVTRAHNVDNIDFFEKLGVDVALSSQFIAVQSVNRQILEESVDVFTIFEKGKAEIREIAVPAHFPPTKLMDLKLPAGVIIAAIRRGGRTMVPCGHDKIKGKDYLRVFCASDRGQTLANFLQEYTEAAENALEEADS
jgi:Trk K+ transport system NAD-binding subunit